MQETSKSKPKKSEEIFFIGQSGKVQIKVTKSSSPISRIGVVFPNDPSQHQGSMDHPIVDVIYNKLVKHNFTAIKMNFRGVGKSEGKFEGGVNELVNASLLIDWILSTYNAIDLWMCGFSYGAWVAMQMVMRRPEVTGFLIVSPQCTDNKFAFLSPCPVSGLLVHGLSDGLTNTSSIKELVSKSSKQKNNNISVEYVEGADHFFRERRNELSEIIDKYIGNYVKEDEENIDRIFNALNNAPKMN